MNEMNNNQQFGQQTDPQASQWANNAAQQPQQYAQQMPQQQYAQQIPQQQYAQQMPQQQYAQQMPQQQYAQQMPQQQYAQQMPQQQYAQQMPQQQYAQQMPQQQYAQQMPQQQFAQPAGYAMPEYDAGGFAAAVPAKKNPLPIILTIIAIAVVVGGIALAIILLMGNSNSYLTAEKNSFKMLSQTVDGVSSEISANNKLVYTVKFAPDSQITGGLNVLPTTIVMSATTDGSDGKGVANIALCAGDEEYLSLDMWVEGTKCYLQINGSDKYIVMDLEEIAELGSKYLSGGISPYSRLAYDYDYDDDDYYYGGSAYPSSSSYSQIMEMVEMLQQYAELIDDELINEIIAVVEDSYLAAVKDTKMSDGKFTLGGVSVSCKEAEIDLNYQLVYDFLINLIDKVKDNSKIMNVLSTVASIDKATLESAKTFLEESVKGSESMLKTSLGTMKCYIKDNQIIGRTIIVEGVSVKFGAVVTDKEFAAGYEAETAGEKVAILAVGTVSGNTYTGSIKLEAPEMSSDIPDISFEITADEKANTAKGNVSLSYEGTTVRFDFDCSENKASVDLSANVQGQNIGTVSISAEKTSGDAVTIPSVSSANSIDVTSIVSSANPDMTTIKSLLDMVLGSVEKIESLNASGKADMVVAMLAPYIQQAGGSAALKQQISAMLS